MKVSEMRECLLCSAFEGGSNYWYMIDEHNAKECGVEFVSELLEHKDGKMTISDYSGEDCFEPVSVNHKSVTEAWKIFTTDEQYKHHYADILKENDDATTGDVFLQLVVF